MESYDNQYTPELIREILDWSAWIMCGAVTYEFVAAQLCMAPDDLLTATKQVLEHELTRRATTAAK